VYKVYSLVLFLMSNIAESSKAAWQTFAWENWPVSSE